MIKAVIFDMDGVLIDTVEIGLQVRRQLLSGHGVDLDTIPDTQGEGHRASSLKSLLTAVRQHSGVNIDHDTFANQARKHMSEQLQAKAVSADPGLLAFLGELKEHGVTCAVASSGLREGIALKLNVLGIQHYFSVIVSADDVQAHKPSPDAYMCTMERLALQPSECIIFEDSLTGIQAGLAAGCKVIGFTQYNPPRQPLQDVAATVKQWSDMSYDKLVGLATA